MASAAPPPVRRGKEIAAPAGAAGNSLRPAEVHRCGPACPVAVQACDRLLSGHPADAQLPPLPAGVVGAAPNQWAAITNGDLTAWVGPWGVSFAMNLTSDKATGLGSWTEEMFVNALRTGKHQGTGRPILPPMPWNWYRNMTDEDLKAMFAYLQSLPPINNPIPDPLPPDKIPR